MARSKTSVERNTFIRGLVTEAGPLTFPENASKDELNFVLNKDGSRQRRLGIDYEENYALVDTGHSTSVLDSSSIATFKWDNVGNDALLSIGVVQVKGRLWFLDMTTDNPSANLLNGGSSIGIINSTSGPFSFASVNGVLVVVGEGLDNPRFLEYDQDTDTITVGNINIEVRDIWGVDDGLAIDERPTTLSATHKYNLRNQGWRVDITPFFNSQGVYPSNADIRTLGKDSNDDFDPALLVKQEFGTTQAPRGRYIIDAFARGAERKAATGINNLPSDEEQGNLTTVASFAGRVFYSGVRGNVVGADDNSPAYAGTVFFTQIVDSNKKLGFCYQDGDPTSEFTPDLLPNDGGTIQIPEAAGIIKLVAKEESLLVFSENGVWIISGSNGGFFADDIAVRKISNVGAVGADAIVDVDGTVVYWAKGGIYQLVPDPRSGRLVAQNITERTIQTRYNQIPSTGKMFAKGIFDNPSRRVKWIYNDSDDYDGVTRVNGYNKELTLDLVLGAFSISDIKEISNGPYVASVIATNDFISTSSTEMVVVGPDTVQVNGEDVGITSNFRGRGTTVVKYLTVVPSTTDSFTLSSFRDASFVDWKTFDNVGVDAAAFLTTGEELFGDTQREKGITYFTSHMLRTESGFFLDGNNELQPENPSGCLVQSRWDFSNSSASGKFGIQFQAYRLTRNYVPSGVEDPFDYGQEVITTKTKLRGSGRALSVRFDTEAGKDCYIFGWGLAVEGNTVV